MRITEKEFNQLKQLDRIEYRQKLNHINETYNKSRSIPALKFNLILISAVTLLAFVALENGASKYVFNLLISKCLVMAIWIAMGALVIDIIETVAGRKLKTKLDEDYFKIIVKNGKNKRR